MIRLLSPGMMLLNRLRYPQKFLLVSLLLVLPLILAIGLLLSETMPRIEFTNRELAGARYIEQLRNLMVQVDESHVLVDEGQSEQMLAHQSRSPWRERPWRRSRAEHKSCSCPVSYTHLTLPTNREV